MKIVLCRKPRGIALIIVMVCIFILAALAGAFAMRMKVETKLAMNANNETELEWMGRSGFAVAATVLGQQLKGKPYDALNQKWAGGPGDTNDLFSDLLLTDVPLNHGKFSVKIVDCERKFNINVAQNNEPMLQQALRLIGVDGSDVPTIIGSIQDWIDRDDGMHPNGAETEYYQSLNPPYVAKNGPIDDLSELLFIKGITPEIYWGPHASEHPSVQFTSKQASPVGSANGLLPTGAVVQAGLVDIFTPISSGQVNVNTASATTLQMIPGVNESLAAEIVKMRSGPDGVDGTEDDMPLQNVGQLVNAGINNQGVQSIASYCTVRSTTFEVTVDVETAGSKRKYTALMRRNSPTDVQILHMRWE